MKHLTQNERYHIEALRRAGWTDKEIAFRVGRSPATISRELRRNGCEGGLYCAEAAHERACVRRHRASSRMRVDAGHLAAVIGKVERLKWSAATAAGRLRQETGVGISVQTIYDYLRRMGGRKRGLIRRYRRRHMVETRGKIPDRVGIAARPRSVGLRVRRGHFEADTMQGKRGIAAVVGVVQERKTRHISLAKMKSRSAPEMNRCIARAIRQCPTTPRTITADNGKENAGHRQLSERAGIAFYFTDPYCGWQKGSVENAIGVLRRWLPKGCDLSAVSAKDIRRIQNWYNNRPLKILGYRTPNEAYNHRKLIAFQT